MFRLRNIYIRAVEESDLLFMKKLRNDPSIWINLTTVTLLNDDNQIKWFNCLQEDKTRQYFIICLAKGDTPIGIVRSDEIDHVNRSMRIGVDICKKYRGLGYGTLTYHLLLKYCFDFLNMNRVWLLVVDYNKVGIHIYMKVGFLVEGEMRNAIYRENDYHDYIMMSILREEYYKHTDQKEIKCLKKIRRKRTVIIK